MQTSLLDLSLEEAMAVRTLEDPELSQDKLRDRFGKSAAGSGCLHWIDSEDEDTQKHIEQCNPSSPQTKVSPDRITGVRCPSLLLVFISFVANLSKLLIQKQAVRHSGPVHERDVTVTVSAHLSVLKMRQLSLCNPVIFFM